MHLGHVVLNASILLKRSFVLLIDAIQINKHLSVNVLRSGHLVMVQLRCLIDILDFVDQGRLDALELLYHIYYLAVHLFLDLLDLLEQEVSLLLELALVANEVVNVVDDDFHLLLFERVSRLDLMVQVLNCLFKQRAFLDEIAHDLSVAAALLKDLHFQLIEIAQALVQLFIGFLPLFFYLVHEGRKVVCAASHLLHLVGDFLGFAQGFLCVTGVENLLVANFVANFVHFINFILHVSVGVFEANHPFFDCFYLLDKSTNATCLATAWRRRRQWI